MVGFAVAGCGAISQAHIESILEIPDARLVSVWNRTPERAEETAKRYGCAWTREIEELVNHSDVHVVNVCTASGAHMDVAVAAARAGKHVLIEKPLEVTPERCDTIIRACEEAGVKLGVVFPSRTSARNQEIRESLKAGKFGRLLLASVAVPWYRSQEYYDSGGWRGTWALDGGGALMNQAIHNVDVLQWLTDPVAGPVVEVQAYADCLAHERIEVEDTVVAVLRFENGALGSLLAATSLTPGYAVRLQLHGSEGGIVLNGGKIVEWHTRDGESRSEPEQTTASRGPSADPMNISFAGHQRLIEDMMAAIRDDRPPMIDGAQGRKSVALINAIYRAARTGGPVRVDR